jgi:hypothetical protein
MKLGIGMYLNIIKAIHDKPIANTILNGEKLKPFSLVRKGKRVSNFSTLNQHILGIPSQSSKTERRNKRNTNWKGIIELSLFADDMILCLKYLKNVTKNLLDTINSFSKMNLPKLLAFLYTNNEQIENEYMKITALQ